MPMVTIKCCISLFWKCTAVCWDLQYTVCVMFEICCSSCYNTCLNFLYVKNLTIAQRVSVVIETYTVNSVGYLTKPYISGRSWIHSTVLYTVSLEINWHSKSFEILPSTVYATLWHSTVQQFANALMHTSISLPIYLRYCMRQSSEIKGPLMYTYSTCLEFPPRTWVLVAQPIYGTSVC